MRSVCSKSAMTPSFMGRMATMLPGVLPSISLASVPTASTLPVLRFIAMMEGSRTTMPLPFTYTSVMAVPRSMARSFERKEKGERKLKGIAVSYSNMATPFLVDFFHAVHGLVGLLDEESPGRPRAWGSRRGRSWRRA